MADPWDFAEPVDVLSKLPPTFEEQVTATKWSERKEALENLLKLLTDNPRLDPKAHYGEITEKLAKILAKDANINVCAVAAKCIGCLAKGLRSKFQPHAGSFIPIILEKFKEKKVLLRDPLIEAIDAVYKTTNLEAICEDVQAAMGKANPNIKIQTNLFLYRVFKDFTAQTAPKKAIKALTPLLAKCTGESDAEAREAAFSAIGAVMKAIGKSNALGMLGDVANDSMKMAQIEKFYEKAVEESAAEAAANAAHVPTKPAASQEEAVSSGSTTERVLKAVAKPVEVDPWDFAEPVDVLSKLPTTFEEQVTATKWSERKEALENLLKLLTDNPRLDPKAHYGEITEKLAKILAKDANINVCAVAAKCIGGLAKGLRTKFQPHAGSFIPIILEKFKEKKVLLRDPLIEAIDAVYKTTNLEAICEDVQAAMGKANPNIKIQTNLFLYRVFKDFTAQTAPKKAIKALTPLVAKCTGESDPEAREAAFSAIGAVMKAIGKPNVIGMIGDVANDSIKMAQIEKFYEKAVEESGVEEVSEMIKSVHKAAPEEGPGASKPPPGKAVRPKGKPKVEEASPEGSNDDEPTRPITSEETKTQGRSASKGRKSVGPALPKSPEVHEPAGVFINGELRNQRLKDEKNLKALKWNFKTPSEEHTLQLNDQFTAVAKPEFVKLLFSKDFKQHLKALDQIGNQIELDPLGVLNNCDLVLKWSTFRFFDTNPQSLNKTLEVCLSMLMEMENRDIKLNDSDVAAFLPFLLMKSGDTKEVVRQLVRKIVSQTSILHVPQKIFPLILDALNSKNSRQKAECLALADTFLEYFGIAIAANPNLAIKTIAACIAERDSTARNAALNCVLTVWRKVGDRVYQMIGTINPKERAMLDERIKRMGRDPQPISDEPTLRLTPKDATVTKYVTDDDTPKAPRSRSTSRPHVPRIHTMDETTVIQPHDGTFLVGNPTPTISRTPRTGRFALSSCHYAPLPTVRFTPLPQIDFGLRPVEIPPQLSQIANAARMANTPRRSESAMSVASSTFTEIDSDQVERTVYALSSTSIQPVVEATSQLVYLFRDQNNHTLYMIEKADLIAKTIATQLSIVRTQHLNDRNSDQDTNLLMRSLCNFLTFFMHQQAAVARITHTTLKLFFSELLRFLCDERTSHLADHQHIVRSVNVITVKLCENGDINEGLVAALHLLDSCILSNAPIKLIELLLKCMFKQSENFANNKSVPIQIDRILTEMETFFNTHASNSQSKKAMDSLKLILQRIIAATFMEIDPYLTLISKSGILHNYLVHCIAKLKAQQPENVPPSNKRSLEDMFTEIRSNITPALLSEIYFYVEAHPEYKQDCDRYITTCQMPTTIDYCFAEFTSCKNMGKPSSFHQIYTDLVASSGQMSVSTHSTNGVKMNDISLPFALTAPKAPFCPPFSSTPVKKQLTHQSTSNPIPNEQVLNYKKRLSLMKTNMNN